jgi:hypothetical protein
MADRLLGLALFLPVPAVLWLFTTAPLGVSWSLALGVLLVATHRLYARPFALRRATRRCLWCGGPVSASAEQVTIVEPIGTTRWSCCTDHLPRLLRLLRFAARHGRSLRAGILGAIAALLVVSFWRHEVASAVFRLVVAITVLPLGWWGAKSTVMLPAEADDRPLASPFPVHIQALIGSQWVAWLFRLVGAVWLVLGARGLLGVWS